MAIHSSFEELGIGPGDVQDLHVCLRDTPPPENPFETIKEFLGAPAQDAAPDTPQATAKFDLGIGGP